jgi:hypothetical protein
MESELIGIHNRVYEYQAGQVELLKRITYRVAALLGRWMSR